MPPCRVDENGQPYTDTNNNGVRDEGEPDSLPCTGPGAGGEHVALAAAGLTLLVLGAGAVRKARG